MFLGHLAAGLAGRSLTPSASLAAWFFGLWSSVAATLIVELTMFAAAIVLYLRSPAAPARRLRFWLLVGFLLVVYGAAAFGPPPPDVRTLAISALSAWLLVPLAWWSERSRKYEAGS